MDEKKFGQFIAKMRKEKGLTQKQLGDKLYVTDKAISKWERGLSLPDISLLQKLADELDIDVSDILNSELGTKNEINFHKELEEVTLKIEEENRIRFKKIFLCIVILVFILFIVIFRNISFGYNLKKVNYSHSNKEINLGVPSVSFFMKHNDKSYSFKNLRNPNIIRNEIKEYLKTLKYLSCNDTIYYYDKNDDFSIVDYSVENNILYSTISYQVDNGDYCYNQKMDEYAYKLGGLRRFHTLNGGTIDKDALNIPRIEIFFLDNSDITNNKYVFTASMKVIAINRNNKNEFNNYVLEDSSGDFEIKDNKLYYYRRTIVEKSNDIKIPEVSVFLIEDTKMILTDNYLSNYEKNIVLK